MKEGGGFKAANCTPLNKHSPAKKQLRALRRKSAELVNDQPFKAGTNGSRRWSGPCSR